MNVFEALQYPFQDKEWVGKTLTAALLAFIPVVGWIILLGYGLRVTRQITAGNTRLPRWVNFGRDFSVGVMVATGVVIYLLPLIIFACLTTIVWSIGGGEILLLFCCCVGLPLLIYILIALPLFYSATATYAVTNDFSAFFDLGDRINDITTPSPGRVAELVLSAIFLLALTAIPGSLGGAVALLLFSDPVLACLCLLVLLVPAPYLTGILNMANFHLIGQWGKIIEVRR